MGRIKLDGTYIFKISIKIRFFLCIYWYQNLVFLEIRLLLSWVAPYTTNCLIYPYDFSRKHLKSHHNDNREAELLLSDRTHLHHLATFFQMVMHWIYQISAFSQSSVLKNYISGVFCLKTVHFRFYGCAILYQTSGNTISYTFEESSPKVFTAASNSWKVCWWHGSAGDNLLMEMEEKTLANCQSTCCL